VEDNTLFITLLLLLFAVAFGGPGLFMLIRWGIVPRRRMANSFDWPIAMGTIEQAAVQRAPSSDGDNMYRLAILRYTYTVGGRDYESDQYAFGGTAHTHLSRRAARRIVKRYPVGTVVTVYYNPNDPADAVLEHRAYFSAAGLAIVFTGVGVLMLVLLVGKLLP
jgi:hypothetical protein